jgi:hypothetical protein
MKYAFFHNYVRHRAKSVPHSYYQFEIKLHNREFNNLFSLFIFIKLVTEKDEQQEALQNELQ